MIELVFINADGKERLITSEPIGSLMEAARLGGVEEILAECGGGCSCATCHVYVDKGWIAALKPPADDEADMLSMSDNYRENSRLSCQINLLPALNGLKVRLPETQG